MNSKAKSGVSSIGTVRTFLKVGACSEALCNVLDRAYDHPLPLEEHAAMPLAGGLTQRGYQCGQIWGAALAAGAQAYRLLGPGPQAETAAILAAQRLVDSFRARYNNVDCSKITGLDWRNITRTQLLKYFITGKIIRCFSISGRYGPVAFSEINTALSALSDGHIAAPSPPVSCAALLAQKMGASDMHTVMAAGLAGGIGLSGGGCGALGAAIWLIAMNMGKEGLEKITLDCPAAIDAVNRFMESTDSEFECSKIVGRRFEDVGDHASYLRGGGCSKIIEVLATTIGVN